MIIPDVKNQDQSSRPVAIVTGGLQGLGLGIVNELLNEGFNIAIVDLTHDHSLANTLSNNSNDGRICRSYQLDIADTEQHDRILSKIFDDFGRVDSLVNNAGIAARPLTDILSLSTDAFDISVDVNLRGTFFLSQKFSQQLLKVNRTKPSKRYQSIIFITSVLAELISTDRAQYCITKSALSMVAKLFSARLAPEDIHVHEIRPGFMQTAMTASVGNETVEKLIANGSVPIPRWGQPKDIGQAVSALAAGRLPYMTGQVHWIAGGLNITPML